MKTNHVYLYAVFGSQKNKRSETSHKPWKPLNTFLRKLYLKTESIDVVKHLPKPGEYIATTIDRKSVV